MPSAEVQLIGARVQQAQQDLIDQLSDMTDAAFRRIPAPGEWTVGQNLAHVCEAQAMWVSRIEMLCREDNPVLTRTPAEQESRADAAINHIPGSLGVARQRLQESNNKVMRSISRLSRKQLARRGWHAVYGDMTLHRWLEALAEHLEGHTQQIAATKGG